MESWIPWTAPCCVQLYNHLNGFAKQQFKLMRRQRPAK